MSVLDHSSSRAARRASLVLLAVLMTALPVTVRHTRIEDCAEAGLLIGVADPAVVAALLPDCGCDACDDGSQLLLDQLDDVLWHVVSGGWTRVVGHGRSVVSTDQGWSAEGDFARDEPARWLAFAGEHVPGRTVTRGAPWFAQPAKADGKAAASQPAPATQPQAAASARVGA